MNKPRIAFLGLGLMGSGMVRRLLAAGYAVSVYNRNPEKAKPLADEGATVAESPRQAALGAGVIHCMVADDTASRAMWLGENGALAGASAGTICIDSSTLTVGWIHELSAAAVAKGGELLDAPVTGSKNQAAGGELNFLVGSTAEALEKVRPVLMAMGRSVIHLGPVGSGAMAKLINNFACAVQIAALAEALVMIERSGLDRTKMLEVLTNGSPGSPLVKAVAARMTGQDYTPNFKLQLMAKDLDYAIAEGKKLSLNLETAAVAAKAFHAGVDAGFGEQDIAAVLETVRKSIGSS